MSEIKAEICRIIDVTDHTNADKLSVCTIKGWNCVIGKNQFKAGDLACYIPIDACLSKELEAKIFQNAKIKLTNGRIKSIKLRGTISQGLVIDPKLFNLDKKPEGYDATKDLGITKYEPPEPGFQSGLGKRGMPRKQNDSFKKYTSIENGRNYHTGVFSDDEMVHVSEKIHGSNWRAGWVKRQLRNPIQKLWAWIKKDYAWEFIVGSHNVQLKDTENNAYCDLAKKHNLKSKISKGVVAYGELFGCFHYYTPVLLANGKNEKIGVLYKKFTKGDQLKVLSYNIDTNTLEPKAIIGFKKTPVTSQNDWITLGYKRRKRGGKDCRIVTTKNHIFFTSELKEVRADDLKIGDTVFLPAAKTLNYIQEQVVLGSLLGDGNYQDRSFYVAHSKKQIEYLNCKRKILSNFVTRDFEKISGFKSKMIGFCTASFHDKICYDIELLTYINKKKQVTKPYLELLSPIAWAFWYMDDGTLSKSPGKTPKSVLATHGFSYDSIDVITSFFNSKGINCSGVEITQDNGNKQKLILFTTSGTFKFQSLIAPYVHPSMSYKMLDDFKSDKCFIDLEKVSNNRSGLIKTEITSKNEGSHFKEITQHKYDIEIEGNHNYFANNILVHNSGIQKGYDYGLTEKDIVLFDIMKDGRYLNFDEVQKYATEWGVKTVPLLATKLWKDIKFENGLPVEYVGGPSAFNPVQKIREGVVIKPAQESNCRIGRKILKFINNDYLLGDQTDFH